MKKKVSVYFALLIMLSGFINGPLATYVNATTNEPQTEHVVKESDVTKDASTSTGSSNNNEKKESTTNTPEKKSDDPELSEIKSRAPSEVNLNKVIEESSKKNLGTTAIATFDAVQTTSSKAHDDVITSFTITDKDGKPITSSIDKQVNFKVNGTFKLPNGEVSEGDTTTIQLPPELKFGLTSNFDLKDSSGNVVAHAVIDPSTKMIVLTYTDYVEKNSDISGSFFFYAKIDSSVVKQEQNVPIDITIGKDTVLHAGDIGYIVYKPFGSDLDKYGTFTSNNLIEYGVSVNRSKKDFNKTIVSDSLSTLGTTIVDGSFKIKKGDFSIDSNDNWFLKNPSDVTSNYTIQLDADKRGFSIDFGDIKSTDGFIISYQVKSSYELVDGEKVTNNAKLTSSNTVVSNVTKDTAYYEAGGSAQGATFKISLHKSNEDGQSLSGAKFEVIRDRNQQSMGIITSDEQGNASIGSLLKDSYTIKEIQAPDGYDISSDPINVTPADFNESKEAFKEIINKKSAPATTEVKGTKTWDDANNQDGKRPASITVNLLADGKQVASTEVTADQNWQYTFSNLPKFADGKEIVYTVTENQVVDYTTEVKGFDITNSYTPGKTSVSVTKSWDDANNQDGLRPESIKVQLLADGQKQGDIVELNSANKWTTTWHDLNQKSAGKDIVYTVEEVKVADYTTTVDATDPGNIKLTNTHAPATTEVKGTKTWDDANNQDGKRPASITVNLLADGKQVASTEVTADQNWQYTFSNLPKFADGKEIVYTVTENQVVDYTTEVKGFDITNSYTPGKTSVSVTKSWDDANNQDGLRPESIKVQLLADGQKQGDIVELNSANKWTTTWHDLNQKSAGKDIVYTVEEVKVADYTTTVDATDPGNIKLTNTHAPATTEVKGTKTWDDANNQDGKRPASITVNLLADGKQVASTEVTADQNWQYTFSNLPKFADGKEIVYTVTENQVVDYTTEVKGFDITNSYTPGKTSVSVTKSWDDANNQDGLRPESIKVQLLADGQKQGDIVELNSANKWTTTWHDLNQKSAGKDIVYTVEEVKVADYTTTVDATDPGNIKLTNTHAPATTEVKGTKTWDDANNQDGKRPASITVNLLADGKQVASTEVTADQNWQYTFSNLPKFADGKEIVYTVTENQVVDYTTEVKGFDITNSYTPGKTSVSVTKSWDDANNQDGLRPESIKVQLLADGQKQGDIVELNSANKWTTTWHDLNQKSAGKDIVYTVEEVKVADYTTTVDATDPGNIKLTNTHAPATTEVKGTKTWDDANNQDGKRPASITVNLLADGKQVASTEVTADQNWQYTFSNLPKFADGKEIVYTVTENQVVDYTTEVKGFDITNSYTPGKTSVSVTKSWDDANNQDGLRPESIKVQLLADGQKQGDIVELNSANKWTTTWHDLNQKSAGKDIVYTVEEVKVADYTTTVDATDPGNIKLTNTHAPATTEVKGTKTWDDANNQDGKRPASITVNLLADGKQVASTEVTADQNWQYTFSNLPKFADGKEIVYTVTENQVVDYTTEVKGFDITNSYTPGKTSVSVTKSWDDANNQDGLRPESIKVQLLADGQKQGDIVELNSANKWTTTWHDLNQKSAGKDIVYTVEEVKVADYTTTVDATDPGNIKLTNTHAPATTEVKGTKTWDDANNQDGKRPASITVNLLADGKQVASTEVTADQNWQYTFSNLPKFADGKEIVYTATENQVVDYTTEVKGFDITNSYTPGKTSVSVTKSWDDANNQDGLRPESIKVQLLADGQKQGDIVELNSANKWTTTWHDLNQKSAGKDIVYTVEEVKVADYTTTVDATDPGNIKLTNTHAPATTEVKGTKTWDDANNQDGKRPASITVNLLADGKQVASTEVTADQNWQYTFSNLPKFADGKEIVYTVTENQVVDYTTEVKGFDITNTYKPKGTLFSNILPSTGEYQSVIWIALGVIFLTLGAILLHRKRNITTNK